MLQHILFIVITGFAFFVFGRRMIQIKNNIQAGLAEDLSNNPSLRLKNMLLFAFGQKKMFRKLIPGVLHFFVYIGFLLINTEVVEMMIDGITGQHRVFARPLGSFYTVLISFYELLGVFVIISCIIFLLRRDLFKVSRFWKKEMEGWPFLDAQIILWVEIILMTALLFMNAADLNLQEMNAPHYPETGTFLISGMLEPLFSGYGMKLLLILERTMWWLHWLGVLAFLNYVPYSKHLHILLAFPNTYYGRIIPKGELRNMPGVAREVKSMLFPDAAPTEALPPDYRFGAKDATDLSWKNLLDAYTCTECGRCTEACPANQTGKLLSPRKIMMDTRDRIEEIGQNTEASKKKTLYRDYISKEEILACTTCNACVEECPVNINPIDIIIQLRRYIAMEESGTPPEWNTMFTNLENNMAPWQFNPNDRLEWTEN